MSPVAVSQQPQASAGAGDELRSSKLNDILDGDVADESGGEAGESGNVTRDATSADTGKAQKGVFSAWLSKRTVTKTRQEVQSAVCSVDTDALSIRALLEKQDASQIITSPREYQLELFEKAKMQNTIAVLDTGSGKTLIAVLLLKHTIDLELEDRRRGRLPRVSFFLADSVTLVFQQAAVLEKNIDQKIDRLCGAMGTDNFSHEAWQKILLNNMIVVLTPEVLNHALHHALVTMSQINLLIFDEAHHAKLNHPYARLIKNFYVPYKQGQRPKIFGMTASPVDAREDPIKAAQELETMLHSQIATASDLSLLRNFVSRPQEIVLTFAPLGRCSDTELCSALRNRFGTLPVLRKHFVFAGKAVSSLGDWCADQVWRLATLEQEFHKLQQKTERKFLKAAENLPLSALDRILAELDEARKFIAGFEFGTPDLSGSALSPKAKALLRFLQDTFRSEVQTRCIVFVAERWTALLIRELLWQTGFQNLRPEILVGNASGEAGDPRNSFRKSLATLDKFRRGEINCLIATSIAEEGLDISDCNLVIRFDLYRTLIQYIQSRGRARHSNSKYVHMLEEGNPVHVQGLGEIRRAEGRTRDFCESLPADRLLQGHGENPSIENAMRKDMRLRRYVEPETKATLTYDSSLIVLGRFISSLPSKGEEGLQATFHVWAERGGFKCEVLLPDKSPIRSALGQLCPQKSIARRSAAFEACLILRREGYIDCNFLSVFHKMLPKMRNARLALKSHTKKSYDMNSKPACWELGRGDTTDTFFLTVLELEDPQKLKFASQPMVLITRTQMPYFPSFPLHLDIKSSSGLVCSRLEEAQILDASMIEKVNYFTLRLFFDVFHKDFEADIPKMSYWLAPGLPNWGNRRGSSVIDWALVEEIYSTASGDPSTNKVRWDKNLPAAAYVNKYMIDEYDGGKRYFTLAVEPAMKSTDRVPPGASRNRHRNMQNILEYTNSLFKKSRHRRPWIEDQPVFRACQLTHRLNWLDEFSEENDVETRAWICLEPLVVSPLPVSVVSISRMLPGIITRLESYLIALEAFEDFGLQVGPDLALEALTKDSDNTEEHRTMQIQFQRGMGKNYERLEFIGDCFLKMATSISLFAKFPEDNEFDYHVKRMIMICNDNLRKTAIDKQLYRRIRSKEFSRRHWYPQGLKLLVGKKTDADNLKHELADKTIADVCEAMIGACFLSHQQSGNVDMAVKAVTTFVSNEEHDVSSWDDYYKLYKKPKYQTADASASHLDLAAQVERKHPYHFKYPRLLRSAFIHPSQPFSIERIPCYQRLEFLGDALLDMASINFLFHRHPNRDPQWLTEHKMAMVSNKFLAALSVKLGFHKHLRSMGAAVEKQNRDYATELEHTEEKYPGTRDYWTNTSQPPKALSDILEAYVGAIFVDSEFNFAEVEHFFDTHIRWFFEDMSVYDTFANNHPTTYLHNLLTLTFGCTNFRLMADEIEAVIPGDPSTSVAAVIVHGAIVGDGEASSTKTAKWNASKAALNVVRDMTRETYREKFKCDCKGEAKDWVGKEGIGPGAVGTAI